MNETLFFVLGLGLVAIALVVSFVGLRFEQLPGLERRCWWAPRSLFAALVVATAAFAWLQAEDEQEHREEELAAGGRGERRRGRRGARRRRRSGPRRPRSPPETGVRATARAVRLQRLRRLPHARRRRLDRDHRPRSRRRAQGQGRGLHRGLDRRPERRGRRGLPAGRDAADLRHAAHARGARRPGPVPGRVHERPELASARGGPGPAAAGETLASCTSSSSPARPERARARSRPRCTTRSATRESPTPWSSSTSWSALIRRYRASGPSSICAASADRFATPATRLLTVTATIEDDDYGAGLLEATEADEHSDRPPRGLSHRRSGSGSRPASARRLVRGATRSWPAAAAPGPGHGGPRRRRSRAQHRGVGSRMPSPRGCATSSRDRRGI